MTWRLIPPELLVLLVVLVGVFIAGVTAGGLGDAYKFIGGGKQGNTRV
jgi:hypothetical protein